MDKQPVPPELTIAGAHRVAVVISGAMLGSLVLLAVVSDLVRLATVGQAVPDYLGVMRTVFYGVGFGVMVLAKFVSSHLRTPRRGETPQAILIRLLRASAVTNALSEVPGILGVTLAIMGGARLDMLILIAMSAGLIVLFFPRLPQWREQVESASRYVSQLDPAH